MERGEIANIHGRYVVLHDKRLIDDSSCLHSLLPNDTVEYEVLPVTNKLRILRIVKREPRVYMAIVKSLTTNHVSVVIPGLPKYFSLALPNKTHSFNVFSVVLLKVVDIQRIDILKVYDSIRNRENDKDLFLTMYEEQAFSCRVSPLYASLEQPSCYILPIQNLTHLDTFTVDPTESKDFDDAISFDADTGKLYVHIVDAHHQIGQLSAEELRAQQCAFTLYLPEHIENILPHHLAEDKLSLIAGEERNVVTVEFDIDAATQNILQHSLYPSIIQVKKRYTYAEFNADLSRFPALMTFYLRWRRETFNIPHVKLHVDKSNGKLTHAILEDYFDDAHRMIETLMVLTNLTVSQHVKDLLPQRYHCRVKDEMELIPFTGNRTMDSILTIKNYKPAVYDHQQAGHFGLGLSTYTHFTSPIRRYFDVIVHRMLAGVRYANLDEVLAHINGQERYIDKNIVQCYNNVKWLTYFEEHLSKIWSGYIITVTRVGVVVLLEENLYEVFAFVSEQEMAVGQRLHIKVKSVDWLSLTVKATIVESK